MQWFEGHRSETANAPLPAKITQLAASLYDRATPSAAVDLIQACLHAPYPLVRVAAAAADLHLDLLGQDLTAVRRGLPANALYARDPLVRAAAAGPDATVDHPQHPIAPAYLPLSNLTTEVLMRGAGEQDELVRDVAVSALEGARFYFENRTAPSPTREESTDGNFPITRPSKSSIVVHGTFARWAGWWRPRRVFPNYLRAHVTPNLYNGSQPFFWSGIYSHRARELGAQDLADWAISHPLDHVFAHSHGGTVAMLAGQRGVELDKLVLLSCPVHRRYAPDFSRIGKVVSVRTRLDLVILADGGRQRFGDPRIEEHVLPLWFSHSATRRADVWRDYGIGGML